LLKVAAFHGHLQPEEIPVRSVAHIIRNALDERIGRLELALS